MTTWNKLATWYTGLVGTDGHKYHKLIMPEILKRIKPHESVLDIGCGTGVLAQHIKNYTGIDASPNMIAEAKKHNKNAKFYVGAATNLEAITKEQYDVAVFMLSIQDMDDLTQVLANATQKAKKLLILMVHPAFRIPRQSGWGTDKARKLTYRRVDRYLSPSTIPLDTKVNNITSYFYHRPLSDYVKELTKNNFYITDLVELADPKPEFAEFPLFLLLEASQY